MEDSGATVICAWCTAMIECSGPRVSHGICGACAMEFVSRLPQAFLASIAGPDGTVTLFSGHKFPVAPAR